MVIDTSTNFDKNYNFIKIMLLDGADFHIYAYTCLI